MTPALFAGLFFHFMLLSLIAIGGFMATLPGMYSYLVDTAGRLRSASPCPARMYWSRLCSVGRRPVL